MGRDRSTVNDKFKWDLDSMYSSDEDIKKDIEKIQNSFDRLKALKGRLSESKEIFYEVLKLMEDTSRMVSHYYVYAHMKHHEDTRINENQAESNKSEMLSIEHGKSCSYVVPEIISMDEKL